MHRETSFLLLFLPPRHHHHHHHHRRHRHRHRHRHRLYTTVFSLYVRDKTSVQNKCVSGVFLSVPPDKLEDISKAINIFHRFRISRVGLVYKKLFILL
jgi:hypothetical protein